MQSSTDTATDTATSLQTKHSSNLCNDDWMNACLAAQFNGKVRLIVRKMKQNSSHRD